MPTKQLNTHTKVLRVLFTGGPNGGKSSTLEHVVEVLRECVGNVKFLVLSESATEFLSLMCAETRAHVCGAVGGSVLFQTGILQRQALMEQWMEQVIQSIPNDCTNHEVQHVVLLCDRGLVDGKVFIKSSEDWRRALNDAHVSLDDKTFRSMGFPPFDLVLHMQSRAAADDKAVRDLYERVSINTSTERLHDAEQSRKYDEDLGALYGGHPGYRLIRACPGFHDKKHQVVRMISEAMGLVL